MRESETALADALGYDRPVTREPRSESGTERPLEQAEFTKACGDIAKRCRSLYRRSQAKRVLRDVWNVIPEPVELRCKGADDATIRLTKVDDTEWSMLFNREDGFDLGLIGSKREASFLRISQIRADLADRDGFAFDGFMVMVPEPGQEEPFRDYFGIEGDLPAHARFNFEDDPAFAAEAVRQAMSQARRPS
jgi:hypothetical protein